MDTTPNWSALDAPGLVCFWNFQEPAGSDRISAGPNTYRLVERAGPMARANEGVFGPHALSVEEGQWLSIARGDCPALNLHGPNAAVTVVAWVKRRAASWNHCEAVAGMWNETRRQRQYALFLNLGIWDSSQQVGGHVSNVGGPTAGQKYCMDAAITSRPVTLDEWHCIGFTYDGTVVRAYLDGLLDLRPGRNPYLYPGGLFTAGSEGSDFTVGAVSHSGKMGNFFAGLLGGLAVYDCALSDDAMQRLATIGRGG